MGMGDFDLQYCSFCFDQVLRLPVCVHDLDAYLGRGNLSDLLFMEAGKKEKSKNIHRSHDWVGMDNVCDTDVFVWGSVFNRPWQTILSIHECGFLALYGMPTFLSGITLRFKPLIYGGITCWLLSIIACFIPYQFHLLLLGLSVIIAWIVPGYILKARFKKISAG